MHTVIVRQIYMQTWKRSKKMVFLINFSAQTFVFVR